jgi:hypothetical protein
MLAAVGVSAPMSSRLALIASLGMLAATMLRGSARHHAEASQTYEDIYYLPPAQWLSVMSLGHDSALADLLWIRSLIYVGDEYGHRGAMRYVFDCTDAVLTLDPDFEAGYHWIASAGLYQPADITRDELLRTIAILERGVARLPESGQLHWDLGATLAFESGPFAENEAEAEDWRLRGIEHLMAATRLNAAPPWMVLSSSSMLARVGASARAVEHLEEMYAAVSDPELRQTIAERIGAIRGESHAAAFVEQAEALEDARLHELPYCHPDMYFLLGPRPPVELDGPHREGFAAHAFDDEMDLAWPP